MTRPNAINVVWAFADTPERVSLSRGLMPSLRMLTSAARCLLVIAALCASVVHADDSKDNNLKDSPKGPVKAGGAKFAGDLKPEQEAAALAFAGEHHPELKTLVESLQSANPDGYKKAVHDLYRTQEHLAKLQGTKPGTVNRHDHELALWKLDSRIRLAAARSTMSDTAELKAELKTLVEQRQALSLSQLKVDREHTAARLAKLDEELKVAEANPGQTVDAEVDRLLNSAKSKKLDVTANLKGNKVKKPGLGEGKPKGEFKPGEGKPKGDFKPGVDKPKGEFKPGVDKPKGEFKPGADKPKGEFKPGEGKPKGEPQPNDGNPKVKQQLKEPEPEPKAP